jgi:DNA repair protein RadC
MHEVPSIERPREKLLRYGAAKLSNAELLAIILGTGRQGMNAVELARKVLLKFPNDSLPAAMLNDLRATYGLGVGKASQIIALFELGRRYYVHRQQTTLLTPRDVWRAVSDIASRKKEHFIVFYVDSRYQEIGREVVSVGTINASLVHPREVFEPAVKFLASGILVVHNHPSGNLEPSAEDMSVTARIAEAGKVLGIPLLDHVIVSREGYLSYKEKGLL